jgi:hypothetical protein
MQPTPGDVHVNQPLTSISIAYMQRESNFIATRVFPAIPVSKQSDLYYIYNQDDFFRDEMKERAPATESAGSGYGLTTGSYFARRWALHKDIPDEVRANQDSMLDADRDATRWLTQKALIRREKIWNSTYFTTGVWGTDITGVAAAPSGNQVLQWNDVAANPIEDVRAGKRAVLQRTGIEPNKMVLGRPVYDVLVDHPDIIARLSNGQTPGGPAKGNLDRLKEIFDLDDILVMNATENTAAEGATGSYSFIGGKKALLCYTTPTPGLMQPSAGYHFNWTGLTGAGPDTNRIRRFRLELRDADRIEIDMAFDAKMTGAPLGYFFTSIIA